MTLSSIAVGASLVQITVTVATPGVTPSDHIPKPSNARKVKVPSPQKFAVGWKSYVPSPLKAVSVPNEGAGGSKSEYESDHPELISVAVTAPVIESASSLPVANEGTVTGGVLLVTTSAV